MAFINSEVDVSLLPAAETVALQKVQKTYLKLLRIEWMITSLFLASAATLLIIFVPGLRSSWWWIGLTLTTVLIILGYYAAQEKSFSFIAYAVREHDVIYQRGWLLRSTKVCPYNRVQNCSIQSGPLERRSGLASLVLYTAGSEGADMRIPGLLQNEAEELRQFILSKINGTEAV
jgi:membrane protein YdbS with pleckstrin-like domain